MKIKIYKYQPFGGSKGRVRGSLKSIGFILWAEYVQHLRTIHTIVVELFESGPKNGKTAK